MNFRLWVIGWVGVLCAQLVTGCVEKPDEEFWDENADESSSSETKNDSLESSVDTLEYVKPPHLTCKEVITQEEYDLADSTIYYNYWGEAFAFWNNEIMRFTGNRKIFKRKLGENLWTNVSVQGDSVFSTYSFVAQKDSIVMAKRHRFYRDEQFAEHYENSLCQTMDMGETWTCDKADSADFNAVSDGMYFYFQRGSLQQYSLDGVIWNDFHLPHSDMIRNAFVVDGVHFFYTRESDLFSSTDFQNWDSTHVPVFQGGTKVVYGNGVFVYAGAWGELKYSTDLVTWKESKRVCPSCRDPWFNDVVFEEGMFIVVGSSHPDRSTKVILTSYNGQDFEEQEDCDSELDYDAVYYDRNGHFYITNGCDYYVFQKDSI
ncbi:MAG: hypothetical protein MJZ22_05905 [Candidatus Saccharibacteria bacterium]|nr:hypothetical protein [Candidatus Saccharibacteria bacterium]